MQYRVQNLVSLPNVDDFRHPTCTYHKVFEKCPKNAGKINLRNKSKNSRFPIKKKH